MKNELLLRNHHVQILWSRFAALLLGLWLLISPSTFGYSGVSAWSDWVSGILLVLFSLLSLSFSLRNAFWGICFVGVWLQMAPLLFWAPHPVIYLNDTLIGSLAIGFSLIVPFRAQELGPEVPPGWSYNPSSWPQRMPVIFFGFVGWMLARYLSAYQLGYIHEVFDPFFPNSETVNVITSKVSKAFPVSDAGLGALAYSLEALLGAKGSSKRWHTMPWLVVVFGILVVPLGFTSLLLIMLQPIAVGSWCGLCLLMGACMLFMLALTVDEVVATLQYLAQVRREKQSLWRHFWCGSSYSASENVEESPFLAGPRAVLRNVFQGVTPPWNLVLSALCGAGLLWSQAMLDLHGSLKDVLTICGALLVAFSVISWAEVTRAVRFLNLPFALWAAFAPLFIESSRLALWHSLVFGLVGFLLSFRRGRVRDRYGSWNSRIR